MPKRRFQNDPKRIAALEADLAYLAQFGDLWDGVKANDARSMGIILANQIRLLAEDLPSNANQSLAQKRVAKKIRAAWKIFSEDATETRRIEGTLIAIVDAAVRG